MPAEQGAGDGRRRPEILDEAVPRRVHVVGIGGAGMSAIASVLASMGHSVSGTDVRTSPAVERLKEQGISVSIGHRADHVGRADVVTYSPAVAEDNVELVEARRLGIPVVQRSEMLGSIASLRRCIAVAGTHGKTTTASMLSLILVEAGLQPSFLIGADVNEIGTNAVWNRGEWVVVEADESYGSFRSIRPEVAVLTNVEPDHLDHYGTFTSLRDAFDRYLESASGARVTSADDPVGAAIGRRRGATSVGVSDTATYRMVDLVLDRSSLAFGLSGPDGPLGTMSVPVPGLHNARNAAMAAVAASLVGASPADIASSLARFTGVPRRFEFRGEVNGVTFVDDYAHLPTEVRAALAAARSGRWPRIVAVFQPHRYTRTSTLAGTFAGAFADADVVVVTDVYSAGERPVPGVSGQLVVDAVSSADHAKPVVYAPSRDQLVHRVAGLLRAGDLCLTLGAGDLTTLPDELQGDPRW
ncbi:MAG: UDP-N-acetylmuramate--L-alanine ligase [Acidimicrobiales bacterium]